MRGHRDLVVATATAALCALVALIAPPEGVRLVAAAPLCVLLPGYAITAAVFAPAPLGRSQVLLFSVGLSLTTLATGGLVLHLLPGGVRGASWATLLFGVVFAGCAIAARRRPKPRRASLPRQTPRLRPTHGALLLGAVLCTIAALALSWSPLPAENVVGYTQLWMLPAPGSEGAGVRIGVGSAERRSLAYRLEVRQQDGGAPVSSRLVLEPGQKSVRVVGVRGRSPGVPVRVTALLYREDRPGKVYRRVSAWVQGA